MLVRRPVRIGVRSALTTALILACGRALGNVQSAPDDSPPRAAATSEPSSAPAGGAPLGPDDYQQMLREALELLDDGDIAAALRAAQRSVSGATPAQLEDWSRECLATRGLPLADLVADLRIRKALLTRSDKVFELPFATPFEADALGRRLEALERQRLAAVYDGLSVRQWARQPGDYAALRADSAQLVYDAQLAAGVIAARLRFDPRLRSDRLLRRDETLLRDDLVRLAAQVRTLPGFSGLSATPIDATDPTLAVAQELMRAQEALERTASQPASQPAGAEPGAAASQPIELAPRSTQPARPESKP